MAKEEGWASVVEATKNGNASILAAVQNTAEATKNGNEKIVAASQNTAAVIEEGHKKSKLSFKGLLGGFAGIFKQNASAEKEKENEEKRFRAMMLKPLLAMRDGIKNMGKSMKEKMKSVGGGLKAMLMKGAMIAGVMALLAFVNSPMFGKLKHWVMDKLIPGLKWVIGVIVDIATTLWDWSAIVAGWIIKLFTDPLAVLNSLWGGISDLAEWFYNTVVSPIWTWFTTLFTNPAAALKQLVAGYGSLVDWIFRNAFIKPWNWVTGLFGFDPIASNFSLWDTISAVFDEVKGWFIGLFKWGRALGTTKDGVWSLSTMIDNAFTLVKDWVIGLFKWGRAAGTTADGAWSLATMIDAAFLKAKAWALSLFTWLLAPEGTSWIQKTVKAAVDLVKKWATSLFTWSSSDNPDDPWLTTKIKEAINLVKAWVVGLFAWVSTAGQVDGKAWSLSTMIDAAVLKVKDWVVSIFTWATDPEGTSWIQTTVSAVVTKVKEWAKSLFAWALVPGDSWISQKVKDVINLVKAWVTGLFSWASTAGQVDGKPWSVITLVQEIITKAIGWVKSLFTWAVSDEVTDPTGWSILGTVKAVIKSAIGWVVGLFTWASEAGKVDGAEWSLSKMIKTAIDTAIGWVKDLFNWIVGGPVVLWTGLVGFVTGAFDSVVKWFTDLFSFGVDTVVKDWTNLKDAVVKIFTSVKTWFTDLFSWGTTDETAAEGAEGFSLTGIISGVFTSIKEWFGKLFKFDSAGDIIKGLVNVVMFVPNIIKDLLGKVTSWFLDLFGFGDAAKAIANVNKFSIGDLVFKAVEAIAEWFKGLFDIDWDQAIKDLAPAWIKDVPIIGKWFGGGEVSEEEFKKQIAKHGQTLKGATKSGLYDENWKGDSTINKEALEQGVNAGLVQKEMLQAIIDDEDISKEDLKFMKLLVEKATTGTSLHVRDKGIHDRLDILSGQDFWKNVVLLAAAQQSALTGGGGGGATIINAPTTTNQQTSAVMTVPIATTDPYTFLPKAYVF